LATRPPAESSLIALHFTSGKWLLLIAEGEMHRRLEPPHPLAGGTSGMSRDEYVEGL
jgi:hypothetical protein